MRLFAALIPSQEAIEHLDAFLEVRRPVADFRWTPIGSWHLTLAFMADTDEWRVDELESRLAAAACRHEPFEARLAGGGAFPDVSRAKVLWAGVGTEGDVLSRLSAGARSAAVGAGIEVDGARFRPHLTLARIAHPQDVVNWARLLDAYRGPVWSAASVALVESHLGGGPHGRPRYDVLAELPLGVR